jgi:hypothetical protein
MSQRFNKKINANLTGTSFTDETHTDVGASAFTIDHDWFINDTASGDVLVIRTAAAGGGTLLVSGVDYTISNQHLKLSDEDHVDKNVYSDITITNATYQTGTLYFSGKYVADSITEDDISQITWQYETKSADETLAPTEYTTYGCTAGTDGIKLTLPAVSEFNKNIRLEFIKTDDTDTAVMIDGSGAETINDMTHVLLIEQYQKIEIMCTGTAWIILRGTLTADSGLVNAGSNFTKRHLGTIDLVLTDSTGFLVGETITEETSNNTGIVVAISGNTLRLWRVTGTGLFTNGRAITGSWSSAADTVNGNTAGVDSDFYHGFGVSITKLTQDFFFCLANSYSEANMLRAAPGTGDNGTNKGITPFGVDTDSYRNQTGDSGIVYNDAAGARQTIAAQDYMYRCVTRLVI